MRGAILIAKRRIWHGKEYVEYTCNSHHRYGKQYCTPHRIHQSQLDERVFQDVQNLRERIVAESERYKKIIKQWLRQKQQMLTSTTALLDDILYGGMISDANLRMLVNKLTVHQNEDKSLDVHFEMNSDFVESTMIILEHPIESAM